MKPYSENAFQLISRVLAKASTITKKKYPIDYSVLKVAIWTLGLLLVVEVLRHHVEHKVESRPFSKQVLEVFYRNLATLGIVEFVLWLLLTYYPNVDLAKEARFTKVHYTIFYTAIINAIQSVIIATSSFAVSKRMWVTTEELELSHYISIRKEFESVEKKLIASYSGHAGEVTETDGIAEETFHFGKWMRFARLRLVHPKLTGKYFNLLVQVRFHEFRYHFINANDLPLKFMVSDYLQRAQLKVLIDLVHINSFAWISVMGAINLVYFSMSMVASIDPNHIGKKFKALFVICSVVFAVTSLVIHQRVKWIFSRIMHMKLIDVKEKSTERKNYEAEVLNSSVRHAVATFGPGEQQKLFWGGNPRYIRGTIQIIQFVFSLFIACLLIFWKDVNVKSGVVRGVALAAICVLSWLTFVTVMARVIPRFTLCTNLGQMINKQLLRECLANHFLEEALKKRRSRSALHRPGHGNIDSSGDKYLEGTGASIRKGDATAATSNDTEVNREENLANLVVTSTKDLPSLAQNKGRTKSLSDGVVAMSLSTSVAEPINPSLAINTTSKHPVDGFQRNRKVTHQDKTNLSISASQRRKAVSYGVAFMRSQAEDIEARRRGTFSKNFEPFVESTVRESHGEESAKPLSSNGADVSVLHEEDVMNKDEADTPTLDVAEKGHVSSTPQSSMRKFLLTSTYRSISAVFGTMFCFFMVAVRMDILLVKSGVTKENKTVQTIPGSLAFWVELSWLAMFVLVSIATVFLFCPLKGRGGAADMCIAGTFDVVLSSACLALLVVAEAQRDAGTFGSEKRLVDGVGNIEPYTSLVALRVLRFSLGKRLVTLGKGLMALLQRNSESADLHKPQNASDEHGSASEHDVHGGDHDSHGDHGGHGESMAFFEQWRAAVACYPDIVDAHGAFSSEVLRTMLGLPIATATRNSTGLPEIASLVSGSVAVASGPYAVPPASNMLMTNIDPNTQTSAEIHRAPSILQHDGRYGSLMPERKAIIYAGLAQQPMKCLDGYGPQGGVSEVQFEVDFERCASEAQGERAGELSRLVNPNASLIRCMRRCERKILPILEKWVVVDVVITKFEIVLLDAMDDLFGTENRALPAPSRRSTLFDTWELKPAESESRFQELVRRTIADTDGGKKLRLGDVVAGRKIVGHLDLSKVDEIKVERLSPATTSQKGHSNHGGGEDSMPVIGEYWEKTKRNKGVPLVEDEVRASNKERWRNVSEHRLRIRWGQGTMYLRFFSDLVDAEAKAQASVHVKEQEIPKNDCFLWCQTMGRICGKEQLKQKLPNFGDLGDDELRDYLEVVDHFGDDHGWRKLRNRVSVVGAGLLAGIHEAQHADAPGR